jgi:hypothetical protein
MLLKLKIVQNENKFKVTKKYVFAIYFILYCENNNKSKLCSKDLRKRSLRVFLLPKLFFIIFFDAFIFDVD